MIYRNRIPAVPVFLCQEPVNGIADGTPADPRFRPSDSEADLSTSWWASLQKNCRKPCTTGSEAHARVLRCASQN